MWAYIMAAARGNSRQTLSKRSTDDYNENRDPCSSKVFTLNSGIVHSSPNHATVSPKAQLNSQWPNSTSPLKTPASMENAEAQVEDGIEHFHDVNGTNLIISI
ncbi:hypothetical protein JYU34_000350 [Plutella xylostella]|uniref:Uncharacterized protein n=1 Tax=Plutella xylostella TaxID=51655 RepID=A0ABQ7R7H1_PLUXY|nr:hypothetical protein JYU34_000350 [Plutella xylostella]